MEAHNSHLDNVVNIIVIVLKQTSGVKITAEIWQ